MKKLLITLLLLSLPVASHSLDERYKKSFMRQIEFALIKNPAYVWGGTSIEEGADCSGILFACAQSAGLPVLRTTAYRMARGLDGWKSVLVAIDYVKWEDGDVQDANAEEGDLIWWTFTSERIDGHVGVRLDKKTFAHASSRYGFIKARLDTALGRKIGKARRLTFEYKGNNHD